MKEENHAIVDLAYGGIHAFTCSMDENWRGLFDMYAFKETPYEIPLWVVNSSLKEVVYHIPYGSTN